MTAPPTVPNYDAIKAKQNAAWASGDYGLIGATLQISGEQLAEAMDMPVGATVLDVAAGNGNITLAMARRGASVTSTDYVDTLLAQGRARAIAEGLSVEFQTADAENLPFEAASFDAVVSTFGVMFTPNQKQSASELLRVCRPGGRIGMANWTPAGFIGQLFKTLGKHVAPPAGVQSPANWGNQDWITETFGADAANIDVTPRNFVFRYASPAAFVEFFRTYYGPVHKAFLALDTAGQQALEQDILATVATFNTAEDGSMKVPSEYLELIITRT
ncbi:MAG: class I SAM-dependent methyltransferase [Pseudomonadota bacterium]